MIKKLKSCQNQINCTLCISLVPPKRFVLKVKQKYLDQKSEVKSWQKYDKIMTKSAFYDKQKYFMTKKIFHDKKKHFITKKKYFMTNNYFMTKSWQSYDQIMTKSWQSYDKALVMNILDQKSVCNSVFSEYALNSNVCSNEQRL